MSKLNFSISVKQEPPRLGTGPWLAVFSIMAIIFGVTLAILT